MGKKPFYCCVASVNPDERVIHISKEYPDFLFLDLLRDEVEASAPDVLCLQEAMMTPLLSRAHRAGTCPTHP